MTLGPNAARKAKTYERNFGARGEVVRAMGCAVMAKIAEDRWGDRELGERWALCRGEIEAAHATPRGMGGARGDKRDLAGLCTGHHEEAGERGTSERKAFDELYGGDDRWLESEARRIALELDDAGIDMPDDFEAVHDAAGHGYEVMSQYLGLKDHVTGWKTPQEASSAAWERWRELTGWPRGAL